MSTVLPLIETRSAVVRAARRPPARACRRRRSGCTCTSRSARRGAATATSTPTRPTSWAPAPTAPSTPGRRSPSCSRAAATLGPDLPTVSTVFVGGGTPTLLPADDLAAVLAAVRELFPVADDVEVTTEANPETVSPAYLARLREAGFTRVSLGMQSAAEHVLAVLDRRHTPGRAVEAAHEAQAAGFEHVNLDLIYGTPGETDADWAASLDAVLTGPVDHVSAYALIVEEGTRLARRISRGELPMPDDDVLADRYEQADATLRRAGFEWYEVSNWATSDAARCRHNELLLGERQLVGDRPRRAQPRRRAALVERQAPGRLRRPARRRPEPRPGRRTARRRRPRTGDRDARPPAARGTAARPALRTRPAPGRGRRQRGGCSSRTRTPRGRAVLTDRGRLLADALVRDLTD